MASEILEGTYTKACDVFSLGVTILELATDLDLPNGGYLWHALREEGPDPMLCKDLSPDLRKTLKLMMGRDHERRPTVGQLLQLQSVTSAASARRSRLKMAKLVGYSLRQFLQVAFPKMLPSARLLQGGLSPRIVEWVDLILAIPPSAWFLLG